MIPGLSTSSLTLLLVLLGSLGTTEVSAQGLAGTYFDEPNLTLLADERLDPGIDFTDWGAAPTGTAVVADNAYSERWTGSVYLDEPGQWTFFTLSNDGVRLFIDGELVIDNWNTHSAQENLATRIYGTGWHDLRLEHFQDGGTAVITLSYQGPGQSKALIPAHRLAPTAGNLAPSLELAELLTVVAPDDEVFVLAHTEDPEGGPLTAEWELLEGGPLTIAPAPGSTSARLQGIAPGSHRLRVTVSDDGGLEVSGEVQVDVLTPTLTGGVVDPPAPRQFERVQVDFVGAVLSENGSPNPFTDRRLDVTFAHLKSGRTYVVPGFYATNGKGPQSNATSGPVWRARFTPDLTGEWFYLASFRAGSDVAVASDAGAGAAVDFDGQSGVFTVAGLPDDARAEGHLRWDATHHLRRVGSGRPFLKGGANSPENLLAYAGFDATPDSHHYAPHVADWRPGDAAWKGGQGKGLVGALNYLAGKGMNAVYFLTFNVGGDGDDVWPWTSKSERLRFDVSKLAQWEEVFDHMDRLGLMLHVVLQEKENDDGSIALDDGALGLERKLYFRELVARFGHHLALTWNLGEENGNPTSGQESFYESLTALDAYDHPVVVHTLPNAQHDVYGPLLDLDVLEGASLQSEDSDDIHAQTLTWRVESTAHGRPWTVSLDEFGPPEEGVVPDSVDPDHDIVRRDVLWAHLMAGGAGVEWYFGYAHPHDDLDCEDWRSRDAMWDQTAHALDFFTSSLPFDEMVPADELVSPVGAGMALTRPGLVHAVYLPQGGGCSLDLGGSDDVFTVRWFDPRQGGALQNGTVLNVTGPGSVDLGLPPSAPGQDWAVVVKRLNVAPTPTATTITPGTFTGGGPFQVTSQVSDGDGDDDVVAVTMHVFSPTGVHVGAAAMHPLGGQEWEWSFPAVPALPAGTWTVIIAAEDVFGAVGLGGATFQAL